MFQVITNNGAAAKHLMTKEIAGNDARQILQANIKAETAKVSNAWFNGRIDVTQARKSLKEYQTNYDKTSPETLSTDVKNTLWKRAKQLKDEFTIGMLSKEELHPVKGINIDGSIKVVVDEEKMNSSRVVERNTAWYNRNAQKISDYKNIMRNLNPDNPLASDIERFRPLKRSV